MTRVTYFTVDWVLVPDFIAFFKSTGDDIYTLVFDWQATEDKEKEQKADYQEFDEPQFMTGFKLLMKGFPKEKSAGFNALAFFMQDYTAMIVNKSDPQMCLAMADPDYDEEGSMINVQDCSNTLFLGDGRELFLINTEMQILTYLDKMCLTPKQGKVADGQ